MLRSPVESGFYPVLLLLVLTAISSCDLEVIPDDLSTGQATETPTYEALDAGRGVATGLAVLSNGGLLLTGSTSGDVYLHRTDVEGTVTLDRSYPTSGNDYASDVLQLSDGTYVVVGTTYGPGGVGSDAFYLRTRADGEPLIGPLSIPFLASSESVLKVTELSDGSLLMVGFAIADGTGNNDLYLLRYSPNLTSQYFQKTVTLPDSEFGYDAIGLDDGFIVIGQILSSGTNIPQGLFARFDVNGDLLAGQPRRFTGISGLALRSIAEVSAGKFLVSGFAAPEGNFDVLVLQTDADGTVAAEYPKVFGEPEEEYIFSSQATPDGGLILAGGEDNDALLLKLDANANEVWRVVSGVNSQDAYSRVVTMPDGGYAVCGYRGESLYYAKTNDQGRVQ